MRTVVADIETNGLTPDTIWCIVCKDIETGEWHEFTEENMGEFAAFASMVSCWIGHNFISFDAPVLNRILANVSINVAEDVLDTLVVSRLLHYGRLGGHSLAQYGKEFNIPKVEYEGWDVWHPDILKRCRVDVEITEKLYLSQKKYLDAERWHAALRTEHFCAYICTVLEKNGFWFDIEKAKKLYSEINEKLTQIDETLQTAFPSRLVPGEPFRPKYTKSGQLHKVHERILKEAASVKNIDDGFVVCYEAVPFNPKSAKDRIERLNEAGWKPTNKTKGHIDFLRTLPRGKARGILTLEQKTAKERYETYGWKTDEDNLATLPETAPVGARKLKERLLLQGKVTRLEEWFAAAKAVGEPDEGFESWRQGGYVGNLSDSLADEARVSGLQKSISARNSGPSGIYAGGKEDISNRRKDYLFRQAQGGRVHASSTTKTGTEGSQCKVGDSSLPNGGSNTSLGYRIHGTFTPIGSWPHRLSHSGPNMANVPKFISEEKTPYNDRMRACWGAPEGRLLVGVDAEGIQLRIFAHLINAKDLIKALVEGRKEDGTDPHSFNQRLIGRVCQSRDAAKRFLYALFFDMGDTQAAAILDCSREEAKAARIKLTKYYSGYEKLKKTIIPEHAAQGYFPGLDGRLVWIPGEDQESKEHFCLSGMLQNGEKIIMARAAEIFIPKLEGRDYKLINWVHDEYQLEVGNDLQEAKYIAGVVADSIASVGTALNLNCPMAGSFLNAHGDVAIGKNWQVTH